jgi:hypothetical protein
MMLLTESLTWEKDVILLNKKPQKQVVLITK